MPARRRLIPVRLLQYALLALVLLVLVFPVFFMLLTSFKTSSEFLRLPPTLFPRAATLANYPYLFRQMRYFTALRNTVLVAGLSALGATLLGGMAAYSFSRATFVGKALMYGLLVASIAVPAMVTLGPVFLNLFRNRAAGYASRPGAGQSGHRSATGRAGALRLLQRRPA